MIIHAPESRALREYSKRLVQLHHMIRKDADEGPEGDSLRDEMDVYWYELSPDEVELTGQISEQLYDLSGRPSRPENIELTLGQQLVLFVNQQRWRKALSFIRMHDTEFPLSVSALYRGICYSELGLPHAAVEFFEAAQALHPHRAYIQQLLLGAYLETEQESSGLQLARQLALQSQDPYVLLKAAELIFVCAATRGANDEEADVLFGLSLSTAERGLKLAPQPDSAYERQIVHGWLCVALCHAYFGDKQEAAKACQQALHRDGANFEALAVWGFLNDSSEQFKTARLRELSDVFRRPEIGMTLHNHNNPFSLAT